MNHLIEFRKTLVHAQYESSDGHISVALGKIYAEHLVHLVYLQSCGKQIFARRGLPCYVFGIVVFVLNLTENLLHYVLK